MDAFAAFSNHCANHLIPEDARVLRSLYRDSAELSQKPGWCNLPESVLKARFIGILTIPVALVDTGSYCLRGVLQGGVEVINGNPLEGLKAFLRDELSALQCAALTIGSLAYAILGLLFGSLVFSRFVPGPDVPTPSEQVVDLSSQLEDLRKEALRLTGEIEILTTECATKQQSIEGIQQSLQEQQQAYRKLEAEKAGLKRQLGELQQQLQNQETDQIADIAALMVELGTVKESLRSITQQSEAKQHTILELQQKSQALQQDDEAHNAAKDKLTQELNAVIRSELQIIHQRYQEELARVTAEKESLTQQIEALQAKVREVSTINENQHREFDQAAERLGRHVDLLLVRLKKQNEETEIVGRTNAERMQAWETQLREKELELKELREALRLATEPRVLPPAESAAESPAAAAAVAIAAPSTTNSFVSMSREPSPVNDVSTLARAGYALASVGSVLWSGVAGASKAVANLFFDGNDPWKPHRYIIARDQLAKALSAEEIHALQQLEETAPANEIAAAIVGHIQNAVNCLTVPGFRPEPRNQYLAFQESTRSALIKLQYGNHGIDETVLRVLNKLCYHWFTGLSFLTFYTKLTHYVAVHENPDLVEKLGLNGLPVANPLSLSEKMELVFKALPETGSDVTASPLDNAAGKIYVRLPGFDPLAHRNIPARWATKVHQTEDGAQLESIHFRTGVPIGPWGQAKTAHPEPWEIGSESFVPEYLAFLRHLKADRKKMLIVLHLDPRAGKKPGESTWIEMFKKLTSSDEFKDTVELALIPLDGHWLTRELAKGQGIEEVDAFITWLVGIVTQADSPYIVPDSIAEKESFVRSVAEQVKARYFNYSDAKLDTKERREAFLGLFDGMLAEAMQIRTRSNVVQRHCKDATDRTMALVGCENVDMAIRLDRYDDPEFHENLIGTVNGPSLSILKRRILDKHRYEITRSVIHHLDELKARGHAFGPVPKCDGYTLARVEWPEDRRMSLYAEPSTAGTAEEYLNLIKFEIDKSFTLPRRVELRVADPNPMGWTDLPPEIFAMLKARYDSLLGFHVEPQEGLKVLESDGKLLVSRSYLIQDKDDKPIGLIWATVTIDSSRAVSHYSYKVERAASGVR